jgi:hypothetical protein
MEYTFRRTSVGPVLVSDDEVLLFNDFAQLQDYVDADPEFFNKARDFIAESVKELSELFVQSLYQPTVGETLAEPLPEYLKAMNHLRAFQYQNFQMNQGFPGFNPQF